MTHYTYRRSEEGGSYREDTASIKVGEKDLPDVSNPGQGLGIRFTDAKLLGK